MNIKKLLFLIVQISVCLMYFTIHTEPVHASEKKSSPLRIVIQVNDLHQMPLVKETLINSLIDYDIYPELLGNINYEASELKAASLNLTQTGKQKTAVQLKIKTKKQLSETALFKDTLSATIEFDVKDMTAPVITAEKNALYRSINADLNPEQSLTVTDNHTDPVTLEYTTDYNNQIPGIYSITYTATDKAENSSSLSLPIYVKQQYYLNYCTDQSLIDEMFQLINDYRAEKGLYPYELAQTNAQHAAGVRAAEARKYLSHDRPNGTRYKTVLDEYGIDYSTPTEILAFAGTTPEDNLNWWKQSTDHNAQLLSKTNTTIAIGTCDGLWAAIIYQD